MKLCWPAYCLLALSLALLFSGCAPSPATPLEHTATATITRTQVPKNTSTPTPRPLPELGSGSTPQGVAQAQMVPEWQQLCEQFAGTPMEGYLPLAVESGVVLFKGVESNEWLFHDQQYPLVSYQDASKIRYLVCIRESSVYEFTYDNINLPANRLIWDATLVQLETGKPFLTLHVEGPYPPANTIVYGNAKVVYGGAPDLKLTEELAARSMFNQEQQQEGFITQDEVEVAWMRFSADGQVLLVNQLVGKNKASWLDEHPLDSIGWYNNADIDFQLFGETYLDAAYSADLNGLMLTTLGTDGKLYLNYLTGEYGDLVSSGQVHSRYFTLVSRGECQGLGCIPVPPAADQTMRNGVCSYRLGGAVLKCAPLLKGAAQQAAEKALAGSADGRYFAAWEDGKLTLWEAAQGAALGEITPPAAVTGAPQVLFAPDGSWVAARFSSGLWRLWSTQPLQPAALLSRDVQLVFYPDGKKLAVFSLDADWIEVYDLATFGLVEKIESGTGKLVWVSISPQGERIAAASLKMIRVFPAP